MDFVANLISLEQRPVKCVGVGLRTPPSLPSGSEFVVVDRFLQHDGFDDQSLDFVVLGSQTYEAVTTEVRVWWPKVRLGGCILGPCNREVIFAVNAAFDDVYFAQGFWATHKGLPPTPLLKYTIPAADKGRLTGCGVLTTADSKFFTGLQLLTYSTRGMLPMAVVDLGLNALQRRWCERYDLKVLPVPTDADLGPDWKYYVKPPLIRDSPFENTLWVDSDAIFVDNPVPIFDTIRRKPFAVRHWHYWTAYHPNTEEAYRHFPVERFDISCNCGVLGFQPRRDREFLDAWIRIVRRVCNDVDLRHHIGYWDEGCFHIAAQQMKMPEIVESQTGWNQFSWASKVGLDNFLRELSPRAGDVILHFSSSPKFWEAWRLNG